MRYNEEHGITPKTIKKDVREFMEISTKDAEQSTRPSEEAHERQGAGGADRRS